MFGVYLNSGLGPCAVAATRVDHLALVGRRADAATIAAEARVAALGLALVILEDEEVVLAQLNLGATERLIRRSGAPLAVRTRLQGDTVKRADLLVLVLRTRGGAAVVREPFRGAASRARHVANKALARRQECRRRCGHHKDIGKDQQK